MMLFSRSVGRAATAMAGIAVLLAASGAAAAPAPAPPPAPLLREGLWVLNEARSHKLNPGSQTLWIVKDDGDHVVWVSVERDPHNMVRISSWDGRYDGKPVEVIGTGMIAHLTSDGPGRLHNWGEIPKLGNYSEDCVVSAGGKRMRCEGKVDLGAGIKTYVDDFDWHAPSPR